MAYPEAPSPYPRTDASGNAIAPPPTPTVQAEEIVLTPEETAAVQEMYDELKPEATEAARNYVLNRTPARYQEAMMALIDADWPAPPPEADAELESRRRDRDSYKRPADQPAGGGPVNLNPDPNFDPRYQAPAQPAPSFQPRP